MSTAIIWLRADLRVHDHPAIRAAADGHDQVVPLFVVDERLTAGGRFPSGPRNAFLRACLADVDSSLRERGAALVIRHGRPEDVVPDLARELGAAEVLWTSAVSPFARRRDRAVTDALADAGIAARPQPGGYCADVSVPRTKAGKPMTVFTPFWRAQRELPRRAVLEAPAALKLPAGLDPGELPSGPPLSDELPEPFCVPGEQAGRAAMHAWLDGPIDRYGDRHDDLSGGTSGLSAYLRWGCISPRELEQRAQDRGGDGAAAFVRQLAWRDFYAHVLLLFPGNARLEFQPRYRDLEWADDADLLEAWTRGRTGYPLVDAGMRQLAASGWMHNRARMVVGSFLTKDLHLDWRAGEAWFERMLLDGEPSQNNGNWQWIASTGVDPAPYFRRMFNPVLQQQKFDPDGTYVRRWVPELRNVPAAKLAEPWKLSDEEQDAAGCRIGEDYPEPVVDHAQERQVAMARYRAAAGAS